MMRRHELDPVSLTFGFAFTGLGLLFLFGQADQALRLRWIWPLLLGILGVAILLDLARGPRHLDTTPDPVTAPDLVRDPDPLTGRVTTPDPKVDSDPETAPDTGAAPEPDATTADLDPAEGPDARGAVDNREHPR